MNEILASVMSGLALLFDGNIGWASLALALSVRLALLQPQVEEIRKRLADKPADMFAAIVSGGIGFRQCHANLCAALRTAPGCGRRLGLTGIALTAHGP